MFHKDWFISFTHSEERQSYKIYQKFITIIKEKFTKYLRT